MQTLPVQPAAPSANQSTLYSLGFFMPWCFAMIPFFTLGSPLAGLLGLGSFAFIAFLELILPPALANVSTERETASRWIYPVVLRGYVPIQAALLGYALWLAPSLSGMALWGGAAAVGVVTGSLGITFAHELGHRRSRIDRTLAHGLMASVGYGQFMVEHYHAHHDKVATLGDHATSRRGESIYAFWWRTIPGQFNSAWALEKARLGGGWSLRNAVLLHAAWAVVLPLILWASLGANAALFWLIQAVHAILLLESVNYIEHYGLLRKTTASGAPERVDSQHSWNTYARPTNWLLVHLQRHADHHHYHGRPYSLLRAIRPAPELPTGYSGSLLLAFVPLAWFAVMHPRLDALNSVVPASNTD